ncbi:beta-ketoacyl synthase N-terminal-like domain-containing protein [Streptomyces sp. NPDC046909]|uniref:type I polyketide synthase n=1 Tax=Streptomyces sp. NPDC046909 TaxID=3155617 RepID=UPI0033BFD65B
MTADAIAITGIDCRFPGAEGPGGYWELLMRSGGTARPVPADRWAASDFPCEAGFLADPDVFDHEFFSLSPREAGSMDPQQRLMLHCAWRAVEDAGIAPHRLAGTPTGVFVGVMGSEWAQFTLTDLSGITAQIGSGNGYCMIANRVSYHLDLKGPSLAVDTACSSSLVAVHLAANSLLAGECDWAIAGGVNLALTPALGIFYTQAGLAAPDGRCKPFSADADGIGRGEGVGAVVLRRYADALADGQPVYAVLRGTAVNQDGRSNGITAPNRWCQEAVVSSAYRRAGVEPSDVAFTEGHGTGTILGDMIETKALGALHSGRPRPMALGSVKGNLGHTEGAAGIAGLIKVALALHHRTAPASRFSARENPALNLSDQGLRLLKAPLRLGAGPVLAGLSSFGLGGTNAHAVLESAPRGPHARAGKASRPSEASGSSAHESKPPGIPAGVAPLHPSGLGTPLFTLTAPSEAALRRNLFAQADSITRRRTPLGPLCWSSHHIKSGHTHRYAVPATDPTDLAARLRTAAEAPALPPPPAEPPFTAWLFTGQGAQYPGMAARLYRESPLFRHHFDAVDTALLPHTGGSVRDLLLGADPAVHRTGWAQPALFAVGHALGASLTELGVRPGLLLGHSVGEFAAAVLAGALPLEASAQLVAARGALMQELPEGGGMIAVRSPAEPLREYVDHEPLVGYAALNGPTSTVLSGDLAALGRIADTLEHRGIRVRRLEVSHAFHSPLMRPVLEPFHRLAEEIGGGVPALPVYSTLRGKLLESEPMDATYWTEHISAPVLFADAAAQLLDEGPTHLVELGPKPVLTTLAHQLMAHRTRPVHPLPGEQAGARDLAEALATLYGAGLDPDWEAVHPPQDRVLTRLTPYAFATDHRFWHRGLPTAPPAQRPRTPDQSQPAADTATDTAVLEAVAHVGGYHPADLSPGARLYEDLGLDSVAVMELKSRIEQSLPALGELPVQELLSRLSTLGDLITYVTEHHIQEPTP